MASGFLQRWQAKVKASTLYLGTGGIVNSLTGQVTSRTDISSIAGSGVVTTQSTAIPNTGVTTIASASAAQVFNLNDPTIAGQFKTLSIIQVATAVFIKTVAATLDGTNTVMKSTVIGAISLRALSTARWSIEGTYQPAYSTAVFPTLSTTT